MLKIIPNNSDAQSIICDGSLVKHKSGSVLLVTIAKARTGSDRYRMVCLVPSDVHRVGRTVTRRKLSDVIILPEDFSVKIEFKRYADDYDFDKHL